MHGTGMPGSYTYNDRHEVIAHLHLSFIAIFTGKHSQRDLLPRVIGTSLNHVTFICDENINHNGYKFTETYINHFDRSEFQLEEIVL